MFNRRKFMGTVSTGAIATLFPLSSLNAAISAKRVIVVGGGMAGATAAKFLRLWSNKTLDVTLVVPSTTYISNIMSNLTVTGQVPYSSLQFNYSKLTTNYGVKVVTGTVTEVSGFGSNSNGTVKVVAANGSTSTLSSERLVLAPGIKMDQIPLATGGSTEVLHAWQAGSQTTALQSLLTGMTAGGTFVLTIPKSPYRCPPGPYERACVVADYLKRNKPGSKIIVCDENAFIQAERENFDNAFRNYASAGVLEYWPAAKIQSVTTGTAFGKDQTLNIQFLGDSNNNYVGNASYIGSNVPMQGGEARSIKGSVMNIIPPHRAADIVFNVTGLIPSGQTFAPVDVISFESLYLKKVHVIGDASNTSLPKAGHVANQEAKICAAAIIASLNNQTIEPMPTANSACFSPINNTQASWLTAIYQYKTKDSLGADLPLNKRFVVWDGVKNTYGAPIEASAPSTGNFSKMNTWFKVLMSDSFA